MLLKAELYDVQPYTGCPKRHFKVRNCDDSRSPSAFYRTRIIGLANSVGSRIW